MTILILLGGILLAATLFASLLATAHTALLCPGRRRLVNAATALLILTAMAATSLGAPALTRLAGIALTIAGIALLAVEPRWHRVTALPPLAFGVILIAGLPFITA